MWQLLEDDARQGKMKYMEGAIGSMLSSSLEVVYQQTELTIDQQDLQLKLNDFDLVDDLDSENINNEKNNENGEIVMNHINEDDDDEDDGLKDLNVKLDEIISNAPVFRISQLRNVLQSYHELGKFDQFNLRLEKSVSNILETNCIEIICKHLQNCKNGAVGNKNDKMETLCRKLSIEIFSKCFIDICARIFDILHCYYTIESFVILFRNQNNCMFVCCFCFFFYFLILLI